MIDIIKKLYFGDGVYDSEVNDYKWERKVKGNDIIPEDFVYIPESTPCETVQELDSYVLTNPYIGEPPISLEDLIEAEDEGYILGGLISSY